MQFSYMCIKNTVGEGTEEIYSYSDFSNVMMSYVMTTFRVVCVAVPALGKPCLLISLFLLFVVGSTEMFMPIISTFFMYCSGYV